MGKHERLIRKILSGQADAAIAFHGLCTLLHSLGFDMRVSGSHPIFRKGGIEEKINLQPTETTPSHIRFDRFRHILLKYKLGGKH